MNSHWSNLKVEKLDWFYQISAFVLNKLTNLQIFFRVLEFLQYFSRASLKQLNIAILIIASRETDNDHEIT